MKTQVVRYRRRRLPARTRLLVTGLLAVLILAVPFAVYVWGRSSSTFLVQKVIVSGDERVSELEIQRLLRADYLGHNLFNVTREEVARSLGSIPFIAAVTVNRDFPLTLRVGIREHLPAAFVLNKGRWYVVAEDGYVIAQVGEDGEGLTAPAEPGTGSSEATTTPSPQASASPDAGETGTTDGTGAATDGAAAGDQAQQDAVDPSKESWFDGSLTALAAGPPGATLALPRMTAGDTLQAGKMLNDKDALLGIAVIAALPRDLRESLAIVAGKKGEVVLYIAGGPEVIWGDGARPLAKGMALAAVLERYAEKKVRCTSMNVSVPDRVLARPMLK